MALHPSSFGLEEIPPDEVQHEFRKTCGAYMLGRKELIKRGQMVHPMSRTPSWIKPGAKLTEHLRQEYRQFAREFTPEDLEKLGQRARQRRFPLTFGLVKASFAIHSHQDRVKHLSRAISDGLSVQQFRDVVRNISSSPIRPGRRRTLPKSRAEFFSFIDRQFGRGLARLKEIEAVQPVPEWLFDMDDFKDAIELQSTFLKTIERMRQHLQRKNSERPDKAGRKGGRGQ